MNTESKRVVFVGIHNKPGKQPLDSSTLSGKTIDGVIELLEGKESIKTNLFNIDRFPERLEEEGLINDFLKRTGLNSSDIVVLLGNVVQYQFPRDTICRKIRAAHPSLQYSKVKRADYIKDLAAKINSL